MQAAKIEGWGRALDDEGTVLFYGGYKAGTTAASSAATTMAVDTFDLIRVFDAAGDHRYRTWQVKGGEELLMIVHVNERRTSRENNFWIPVGPDRP